MLYRRHVLGAAIAGAGILWQPLLAKAAARALEYMPPTVVMARNRSGSWIVSSPLAGLLNTRGSATSGLQEAINHATSNGLELRVFGGRNATIDCHATLSIPPLVDTIIDIGAVNLYWPEPINGPGIEFDTIVHSTFVYRGNSGYRGNDAIVRLRPRTEDSVRGVIDSDLFFFRLRALGGDGPSGLHLDMSSSPMRSTKIEIIEIEGRTPIGGTIMSDGVRVTHPTVHPHQYVLDNTIICHRIKGCRGAGIRVGVGTPAPDAGRITGNRWSAIIFPHGAGAVGLSTWERSGRYDLSISKEERPFDTGIVLEPGASGNLLVVSRNDASINRIVDDSSAQNNKLLP